jgi:hypothetical protein
LHIATKFLLQIGGTLFLGLSILKYLEFLIGFEAQNMMHGSLIEGWLLANGWESSRTASGKLVGIQIESGKVISYFKDNLSLQWGHEPKQFNAFIGDIHEGIVDNILWFLSELGPQEVELNKELFRVVITDEGFAPQYKSGHLYVRTEMGYINCDSNSLIYGLREEGKIIKFNGNIEEDNMKKLISIILQIEDSYAKEES